MQKTSISFLLLVILFAGRSYSQTIPLWEKEIPGSISSENYREQDSFKDSVLHSVSQVMTPTLTVFAPEKVNGTAVIICPGGGYSHLAIDKEGFKVAKWLNTQGITAFVLKYRLPNDSIMKNKSIGPLQDVQKAMELVRSHSEIVEPGQEQNRNFGIFCRGTSGIYTFYTL